MLSLTHSQNARVVAERRQEDISGSTYKSQAVSKNEVAELAGRKWGRMMMSWIVPWVEAFWLG